MGSEDEFAIGKEEMMLNHVPRTWDRVWALSVDGIILFVLSIPLWADLLVKFVTEDVVVLPWWRAIALLFLSTVYDFVFVWLWGKTPGKWMAGLRIIPTDLTRERPNFIESLIRALMDRLTLFFGYAPYCVAFFRYDRSHLLDLVAETRVVADKPRPINAKLRPLSGLILILFFAASSWRSLDSWAGSVQWTSVGISLPGFRSSIQEAGEAGDFQWNPKDFESDSGEDSNNDFVDDSGDDSSGESTEDSGAESGSGSEDKEKENGKEENK